MHFPDRNEPWNCNFKINKQRTTVFYSVEVVSILHASFSRRTKHGRQLNAVSRGWVDECWAGDSVDEVSAMFLRLSCIRLKCSIICEFVVNVFGHLPQLKGFSFKWDRMWLLRFETPLNNFSQNLHLNLYSRTECRLLICLRRVLGNENSSLQIEQVKFVLEWTKVICCLSRVWVPQDFLHFVQWYFGRAFGSKWVIACRLRSLPD